MQIVNRRRPHLTHRSALLISSFTTFLEFLLWLFLPISALLFILREHFVNLPKILLPGLTTSLMIRDFCALGFLGNCIPSLFMEPHQGSRARAEDKIASHVYKRILWLEMTFWVYSLHILICKYIYIYICIYS